MIRKSILAVWLGMISTSVLAADSDAISVSNDHDSGPGSFRAALAQAEADPMLNVIRFERGYTIHLQNTLTYRGSHPLTVNGGQALIDGSAILGHGNLFDINSASPVVLKNIEFRNSHGSGVVVTVPADAVGIVSVMLDHVAIGQTALYGLHIDDNFHAKDEGDAGSGAGIHLTVSDSVFIENGIGDLDYDGIRVDERSAGGIIAHIINTRIDHNGGDGLELDEGGAGSVTLTMINSELDNNGFYNQTDLDDGLDIDEAGSGDVNVTLIGVHANANFEQGLDLDESGEGEMELAFFNVQANANADGGIKVDEDGDGDISIFFNLVEVTDAMRGGIHIEQQNAGRLNSELFDVLAP